MFYKPKTKGQRAITTWEKAGRPRNNWEQGDEDARLGKQAARQDNPEYLEGYECRMSDMWQVMEPVWKLMQETSR